MVAKALRFTETDPVVIEIPRLSWDEIDELFYQDDEIGEMRHTAFMIECGLEEDPPDGPDVPPIPWKLEDIKDASNTAGEMKEKVRERPQPSKKIPPKRTFSMDPGLKILEQNIPKPRQRPEEKVRIPPKRSLSMDPGLNKLEETLPQRKPQRRGRRIPIDGPEKLESTHKQTENVNRKGPHRSKSGSIQELLSTKVQPSMKRASRLLVTKSGELNSMVKRSPKRGKTKPAIIVPLKPIKVSIDTDDESDTSSIDADTIESHKEKQHIKKQLLRYMKRSNSKQLPGPTLRFYTIYRGNKGGNKGTEYVSTAMVWT